MNINLKPKDELRVDGKVFVVQSDPDPNMINRPYVELGGSGLVLQLTQASTNNYYALKIFNNPDPSIIKKTKNLEQNNVSQLPGLIAAQRSIISSKTTIYKDILSKHPFLDYSVLMPWMGGYTWFEILGENKGEAKIPSFSKNTSLFFGSQLAHILCVLEKKGFAHCDICSNNIILDFKSSSVHLIDIEDMYLPGALKSAKFIGGQNGYAHPYRPLGHQWVKESDRFGGGMLISEILSWCYPKIRKASDAESYATPSELCKDPKKYELMLDALDEQGGSELTSLYSKLWNSKSLDDCPTLNEWDKRLKKIVKDRNVLQPDIAEISQFGPDGRIRIVRKLVSVSGKAEVAKSNLAVTRKKVNVGVPQKTNSNVSSSSSLPGFKPSTDWGTIILWLIALIVGVLICLAISSAVGGAIYINSPSPASSFSPESVAPVIIVPTQTLISVSITPTNTLIPVLTSCSGAPPQRVEVGKRGFVCTQIDRLIVRTGPRKGEDEITRIVPGTYFRIIDGPVCANNWSWWEIKTDEGIKGWVSEGGDNTDSYYICPQSFSSP